MKPYIQTKIPAAAQIDYIMDTFDFAKVRETMVKLDWTWQMAEESPMEAELRQTARELLQGLGPKITGRSTGGFYASIDPWGHRALAFAIYQTDSSELESS